MKVVSRALLALGVLVASVASAQFQKDPPPPPPSADGKWMKKARAGSELYATLKTSSGDVVVRLFSKETPNAVANFVGLATGEREWTDAASGKKVKKPLYVDVPFHRVISGFMIQTGDPMGNGRGGPGFQFEVERSNRLYDRPGLLGMARKAALDSQGSQFFITVAPARQLDGGYTIFGEVVAGMDTVYAISQVKTSGPPYDNPLEKVLLKSVTISDKAPKGVAAPTAGTGAGAKKSEQPKPQKP
jgi:peptidyl-prolyl cis-trans isomerase A (cyclophilin A)